MMSNPGLLLVLSGPSGAGKGNLRPGLLEAFPDMRFCVSATTRRPRPGEVDGVHYHFLTRDDFENRISRDQFLEWATVYGNYYGTPKEPVERALAEGKIVLLEKDMQGAVQLKKKFPQGVFVFVLPPSMEELRRRLVGRGTESPQDIQRRWENAARELEYLDQYDYAVVNDNLEDATARLRAIVVAERCRVSRQGEGWLAAILGKGRSNRDDQPAS